MKHKTIQAAIVFAAGAALAGLPEMPAEFMASRDAAISAASAATALVHPDADVVLVDERVHVRYEPDGTFVEWSDEWLKALTEKGRRSLSSVSLDIQRRYGDAAIQTVEIFDAKGRVRAVDFAGTLKEATDNSSTSMNIYDPLDRTIQCSVPGLAVGETRHVVTCKRTITPRMHGAFADIDFLEATMPILSARVSVDEPASNKLRHAVVRHEMAKRVERMPPRALADGRTLQEWRVSNVPQIFPEPDMPPVRECVRALHLSTVEDWPTVSCWYWNLCLPHIAATTAAMSNKVAELVKDVADPIARTRAVFRFVSQQVRYMGLTLEDVSPGYAPHDVSLTFANRYGVCRDKAALLVAMLRIAGLRAYPVLIRAGGRMDPDVPLPYFNHAVAAIEAPDRDSSAEPFILMDPTDESARDLFPSYLANCSYLVATPEGDVLRRSPVRPWQENAARISTAAALSENGTMLVETKFDFTGINDVVFRHAFRRKTPKARRELVEGLVRAALPGAEILAFDVAPLDLADTETPLTMKVTAQARDLVLRGRTRDRLLVPEMAPAFGMVERILDSSTTLEHRRFPLRFPCTAGVQEHVELRIGEALGPELSMPKPISIEEGGYSFARGITATNGVLSLDSLLVLGTVEVSPDGYPGLKFARKEQESELRPDPVFAARENANANVRIRLSDSRVHLVSPHAWMMTNVVEKEVLTYQGKKSASELKFSYNSAVRSVEIVSATVSNANGRVASLSRHEINELDASWVAAAPRYPAGRILVANLPAVEKGSVIRVKTVETVTNAPLAYWSFMNFEADGPVDELRREVSAAPGTDFLALPSPAWSLGAAVDALAFRTNFFSRRVVRPRRLRDESMTPPASFWRDTCFLTAANWEAFASELEDALAAARDAGSSVAEAKAKEIVKGLESPKEKIRAIRKFLVRTVRVAGPGLYELPFSRAFFPPDRSLADGYASRADWFNLYFTMLEAVGFSPRILLSADDDGGYPSLAARYAKAPRPAYFSSVVLRVDAGSRSWFWPFGDECVLWLGTENEYTPVEASSHFGDNAFDLSSRSFVRLVPDAAVAESFAGRVEKTRRLDVRESGAVDYAFTNRVWGSSVGAFRKRYSEMLPEKRSRHYMEILGALSENASATSELFTDVEGNPFVLAYSAYVEEMAVVKDDAITLTLPGAGGAPFASLNGEDEPRSAPISVAGADPSLQRWEVSFPKGYCVVETMPDNMVFSSPAAVGEIWFLQTSTQRFDRESRRLVVTVERRTLGRADATLLTPDCAALLKGWNRDWSSPRNSTIVVRRRSSGR